MRFSLAIATLVPALAASAADILVKVGANGGLVFDPTSVTAAQGDNVLFQFQGKNHSVTQSTFANPCQRMTTPTTGIDSGFQPVPTGSTNLPQWSITVNNASAPLWFFCAQTNPANHCQAGMVFAINPTASKTFDAFQAAAKSGSSASSVVSGSSSSTSVASLPGSILSTPAASGTGTAGAGTGTATGTSTAGGSPSTSPPANPSSGAMRIGSAGTSGLLALVGLVVGLVL